MSSRESVVPVIGKIGATGAIGATEADGALDIGVVSSIAEIPEASWNALLDDAAIPFLDWAFLESLESSGCVGPKRAWNPRHLTLHRKGRLVAAAPAYVCQTSDGDFSRDWGFADGAMRAGISYYPKLAIMVPFTPATGTRFLVAAGEDRTACIAHLIRGAHELAAEEACSAVQVLFPTREEALQLESLGMARLVSFQYHWRNESYAAPEDFLARFDSKRRNQLKRERAAPAKQGIEIRTVRGDELAMDPRGWARSVFHLHRSTVDKLPWGRGWLNLAFYERLFASLSRRIEVVEARKDGKLIAGAFNLASPTHLFGRYWGCHEDHPFLHFNVCLYHSVDECIRRGVKVFEGGAGGEHKMARGFEPAETFAAHTFFDPRLDEAVRKHVQRENRVLAESLLRFRESESILKPITSPNPEDKSS